MSENGDGEGSMLSELGDGAVLTSNLFDRPVRDRHDIARLMRKLETAYVDQDITFFNVQAQRHIVRFNARLTSGEPIEVIEVWNRDADGQIVAISLDHAPPESAKRLKAWLCYEAPQTVDTPADATMRT